MPLAELCVRTDPKDFSLKRISDSLDEIYQFIVDCRVKSLGNVRLIVIEDFAYAGRYSSFDIAMQAGVIRHTLWTRNWPLLFIPPSSLKGWLGQEGIDVRQRDKKAPAIEYIFENKGYKSKYKRKGDYNHTCDAGVLAYMGLQAYKLDRYGEFEGTERQMDIWTSTTPNKKGQPKGLLLRPEYYTMGNNAKKE